MHAQTHMNTHTGMHTHTHKHIHACTCTQTLTHMSSTQPATLAPNTHSIFFLSSDLGEVSELHLYGGHFRRAAVRAPARGMGIARQQIDVRIWHLGLGVKAGKQPVRQLYLQQRISHSVLLVSESHSLTHNFQLTLQTKILRCDCSNPLHFPCILSGKIDVIECISIQSSIWSLSLTLGCSQLPKRCIFDSCQTR